MPPIPAHKAAKRKHEPTPPSNPTTTSPTVQTELHLDKEMLEPCLKKLTSETTVSITAWETAKLSASAGASKLADFHHQAAMLAKELDKMIAPMLTTHPELSKPLAKDLANAFQAVICQTATANDVPASHKENVYRSLSKSYAEVASCSPNTVPFSKKQQMGKELPFQQEKEDNCIMVRLLAGHPVRLESAQAIRAKLNSLTTTDSLVEDVHHVASGLALVASTSTKLNQIH